MPELRRYLTRASELLVRVKGATDQLCAGHQQLSPHRHLQELFMAAMRESLCWHLLHDPGLAQTCLEGGIRPNQLRRYEDLAQIPEGSGILHTPQRQKRDRRRWAQVFSHSLCDLGWSVPARRNHQPVAEDFRCSAGHWHLPRVVRWQSERLFTPCYNSTSLLSWTTETALNQGICPCGRQGQWSLQKTVLPL